MERTQAKRSTQLELLSTQELQSILTLSVHPENNVNEAMIEAILDILDSREDDQADPITTPQQALDMLRHSFNAEDGQEQALYPMYAATTCHRSTGTKRRWRFVRSATVIAASVALVFTSLFIVQAAGIDAFGALAKWSENTFHFVSNATEDPTEMPTTPMSDSTLYQALENVGIPGHLAPTYIPTGYTLESVESDQSDIMSWLCAGFDNGQAYLLTISFEKWENTANMPDMMYEKSSEVVEVYTSNHRSFYLFCNIDQWRGAWSNSEYTISINGVSSKEELIRIIDSIQEVNYD